MQLVITLTAIVLFTAYYVQRKITSRESHPEPPSVISFIPFLGHAIGLMRKKADYYVELYRRTGLPILRINVGTQKMYIVNSPSLIKLVQRQPKIFAFTPIAAHFTKTICHTSNEANAIVDIQSSSDAENPAFVTSFFKMLPTVLAPGSDLDDMNQIMIKNITDSMQRVETLAAQRKTIMLSRWLRHEITMATTNTFYGPSNPYLDSKVEEAFWSFTEDLGTLVVNILPRLTAPKGHKARKIVADAFQRYFTAHGHENGGCSLVQSRYRSNVDHGMAISDIARFEVGSSIAILVNTSPVAFWMLFYIYSDSVLLQDCRRELDAITTTTESEDQTKRVVNINAVKTRCQLFTSIFTETLRCRGIAIGARRVMQDAVLDETYLLKKGGVIMMPARVLHSDSKLWGSDVQEFHPKRFMKDHEQPSTKHDPIAFRGFGGGSTLCPGRHFATTEIFAIVVMFVLRYDIHASNGWKVPTTNKTSIASGVMEPDDDIEVLVSPRHGFEGGEWTLALKESEMVFAVAAEDRK